MVDPLVSCVMPTYNRQAFLPAAIDCFLRQTYQNKELIILDDSDEPGATMIDISWPIRYVIDKKRITGTKRNCINEMASGEIICHFDDDDFSCPDRIADQVNALRTTGLPVTGYGTLLFWDTIKGQAKLYKSSVKGYVCGTSLCYLKSFWHGHKFKDLQKSSDNGFVYPIVRQIAQSMDTSHMVARIHGKHTSPKTGIQQKVSRDLIPAAFWENEKLRLA
jgi:O-antigen biosynthesis protein